MPTMTVREAARRLGVKPSKVQLLISQRKLSARPAPPEPGQRGANHILLDADEVEMLARVRAHKQRAKASSPAPAEPPPAEAADELDEQYEALFAEAATELPEALTGDVELERALAIDAAGRRMVALVQSMLTPLVAELHDARETIRHQAEELGALRATVSELERRAVSQTPAAFAPATPSPEAAEPHVAAPPDRTAVDEAPPVSEPAATAAPTELPIAPAAPAVATIGRVSLWRRAVTHLLK